MLCVCCNFVLDRVRSGFVDVVVLRCYGGVCKYLVSWLYMFVRL